MQWCNVTDKDIVGIIQPAGIWGYADLTAEACKQIGSMYVHLGSLENEMCVKMIYDLNISVLDVSPSRLWEILEFVNGQDTYQPDLFPVSIIMSAGEKLSPEFVSAIHKRYPLISIYDQYGSEEFDGLGGTDISVKDSWSFRLFEDDFIFEVLDEYDIPVQEGTIGKLVVTSLYHKGTPLIRYSLDDFVVITNNRLQVLGRGKDWVILFDSVKINKYQIQKCVSDCLCNASIWQLQVSQFPNKTILLKLVIADKDLTRKAIERLNNQITRLTIDIYELYRINKIKVEIVCDSSKLVYSKRGKLIQMLDMRK